MRPTWWWWKILIYFVGGILTVHDAYDAADDREMFFCSEASCDKVFLSRSGRDRHVKTKHRQYTKVLCRHGCGKDYMENNNVLRYHERTCDRNPNGAGYEGSGVTQQHYYNTPSTSSSRSSGNASMELIQSSHAANFRVYRRELYAKNNFQAQLRHAIMHDGRGVLRRERNNVKFNFTTKCIFEKALRPGVFTDPPAYFKTSPVATTRSTPIETILQGMFEDIWGQINAYVRNGSGWTLREVLDVDMQVCCFRAQLIFK